MIKLNLQSHYALKHYESPGVLTSTLQLLNSGAVVTETSTPELITQLVRATGVKRSVVMRTLRAALTGRLDDDDLSIIWAMLHKEGLDKQLFEEALIYSQRRRAVIY